MADLSITKQAAAQRQIDAAPAWIHPLPEQMGSIAAPSTHRRAKWVDRCARASCAKFN